MLDSAFLSALMFVAALHAELASQCEGEVSQVKEELRAEAERHQQQLESMAAQRQREVRIIG